jgi:peptidoglycan/xylan/chitin deacetylase (PgdA/CDA1 family)
MRQFQWLVLLAVVAAHASANPPGQRFVSIAFHDIVDPTDAASTDAVTGTLLAQFFDWLKRNGWTAVSLADVSAAARGSKPLPRQAILITFDDGFRDLYTRAYPLLKAYRYPAVAALVGSWMEPRPDGTVLYGDQVVPRERFVSWAEAREMQESGLVEFASHSYDLHRGVQANPQGNLLPAAIAWRYDPATTAYENDIQYRDRIRSDLTRSRELMTARLGRPPRAMVWPFGRYTGPALEIARQVGFEYAVTLEPEPASTSSLSAIHRYYPSRNATLSDIVRNLRFEPGAPTTRRIACLALDGLAAAGIAAAQDEALGRLIENLRALGANTVVLDAHAALPSADAPLGDVYFPTPRRPLRVDLLSRASWQIRTRAGAEVFLRLPIDSAIAAVGEAGVPALVADMARQAPSDGVAIEMRPPVGTTIVADLPGEVRARREALDLSAFDPRTRLGLSAYRAAAAFDPRLRLMIVMEDAVGVPDWADIGLLPRPRDAAHTSALAERLRAGGWLRPEASGRVAFSLPVHPDQQIEALRRAQRLGASAIALCPGQPSLPASPALAAAFSAAVFPYRQ